MNYRKVYIKIIFNAKLEEAQGLRSKKNGYYERHHILPKSLFPLWKKKKTNIVLLTAREHFFCHQLLSKIYPSKEMAYALIAFTIRPNSDYKISSREYERLKIMHSNLRKGINTWTPESRNKARETKIKNGTLHKSPSKDCKNKISSTLKKKYASKELKAHNEGHLLNESTKEKISAALKTKYELGEIKVWNKGQSCPSSQKFGKDNGMFGKTWWTNGKDNIASEHCPEGYWKGITKKINKETEEKRKKKISEAGKGKHWFNNGKENKFCYECPEGYVLGFLCKRWLER